MPKAKSKVRCGVYKDNILYSYVTVNENLSPYDEVKGYGLGLDRFNNGEYVEIHSKPDGNSIAYIISDARAFNLIRDYNFNLLKDFTDLKQKYVKLIMKVDNQ